MSAGQHEEEAAQEAAQEEEVLARYGTRTDEQEMRWNGSVMCMERHVNRLPTLLGVRDNHLTIGVSELDIGFLSGRGSILIERAVKRFGDYTYALVSS